MSYENEAEKVGGRDINSTIQAMHVFINTILMARVSRFPRTEKKKRFTSLC